jgi:peptidoglycan/xylan/chitin deacetylase (PgdA/CDA1 family)
MTQLQNLITVDLDERHAGASSDMERVAEGLLEALQQSSTPATFFVTKAIARSQGDLVRRIAVSGHEVACLSTAAPKAQIPYSAAFRDGLLATRSAIEETTGSRVRGHRVSGLAIDTASEWAYDVLVDEGFEYDSSRFPVRRTDYDETEVPRTVHAVQRWSGTLLEVPPTTADILALRVQLGTAASVRSLPLAMWRHFIQLRQERNEPIVLHLRASDLLNRDRLQFIRAAHPPTGDRRALQRVAGILRSFPFTSVAKALPALLRSAPIIES